MTIERKRRWGIDSRQRLAPEALGPTEVLALQPGDVVRIGGWGGQVNGQPSRLGFINTDHLPKQQAGGPAVEQQVMMTDDDRMEPGRAAQEIQPHQWRPRERKAASPVVPQQLSERDLLRVRR